MVKQHGSEGLVVVAVNLDQDPGSRAQVSRREVRELRARRRSPGQPSPRPTGCRHADFDSLRPRRAPGVRSRRVSRRATPTVRRAHRRAPRREGRREPRLSSRDPRAGSASVHGSVGSSRATTCAWISTRWISRPTTTSTSARKPSSGAADSAAGAAGATEAAEAHHHVAGRSDRRPVGNRTVSRLPGHGWN